jgi:hypothetical protein
MTCMFKCIVFWSFFCDHSRMSVLLVVCMCNDGCRAVCKCERGSKGVRLLCDPACLPAWVCCVRPKFQHHIGIAALPTAMAKGTACSMACHVGRLYDTSA